MDKGINLYTRDEASGTREVFWQMALDQKEIASKANVIVSNGAMKSAVAGNPYGIGYVSVRTYRSNGCAGGHGWNLPDPGECERAGFRQKSTMADRVEQALKRAFLWDEVKDRLNEDALLLSGGQQRLCIARRDPGAGDPAAG